MAKRQTTSIQTPQHYASLFSPESSLAAKARVAEEVEPGPACVTEGDLIDFCRRYGRSNNHATSSCKMGVDKDAVVDPRLRVHRIGRLRVIDASIMPNIVGGNTNAATIMIAEKGAAMMIEDAR